MTISTKINMPVMEKLANTFAIKKAMSKIDGVLDFESIAYKLRSTTAYIAGSAKYEAYLEKLN